jgi:hypothetical protein
MSQLQRWRLTVRWREPASRSREHAEYRVDHDRTDNAEPEELCECVGANELEHAWPTASPVPLLVSSAVVPASSAVQNLADLARERFRGERLVQEGDARLQDPMLRDRILGVTGHVDHLERRSMFEQQG